MQTIFRFHMTEQLFVRRQSMILIKLRPPIRAVSAAEEEVRHQERQRGTAPHHDVTRKHGVGHGAHAFCACPPRAAAAPHGTTVPCSRACCDTGVDLPDSASLLHDRVFEVEDGRMRITILRTGNRTNNNNNNANRKYSTHLHNI